MIHEPLTLEEILILKDEDNFVSETVCVDLDNIIDCDYLQFLDLLSRKLTGLDSLTEIRYAISGADPDGTIRMCVTGNASGIMEMLSN